MAIREQEKGYLDKSGKSYEHVTHNEAFTTVDEAKALGIDSDVFAKNLVIRVEDKYIFAVLPGKHRVDTKKLRKTLGSAHARLCTEEEMEKDFSSYEVGAVPPLGELFKVSVYVDKRALESEDIVFTGGTHTDSIKMKTQDFVDLVKPKVVDLVKE